MRSHAGRASRLLSAGFIGGILFLMAADSFAAIVSIQAISRSNHEQDNVPVTFGEVFRPGDVPTGAVLGATIDGEIVPVQVDRKAVNPDGSLRHAVITVLVPKLPAFATRPIDLSIGVRQPPANPVTLDDVLATGFDARISLDIGGAPYTADARQFLQQARAARACRPWGRQCNTWLSGPLVSEWIVGGPLTSAAGPDPHLFAYFYVRAYGGGSAIRVNAVIENDWAYVPGPHNVTYDAKISVGGRVAYSKDDIEHYVQSRWHKVAWWGAKPDVYAKLDGRYIQATGAVSRYADVHPTDEFLGGVLQNVEPMGHADQSVGMGATGAQGGIGPLPRWTTVYLLSMDQRAFNWMLANDDAAGHYGNLYRDKNTGRPVSVRDYPYVTIAGTARDAINRETGKSEGFPGCDGDCSDPYTPDPAHEPSIGYLPYIVTGDFYYLEQLQFWANWNEVRQNPGYRDYTMGLLAHNQVRGQAWDLRTLADAAYITPDDDPLKTYFNDMVQANIDWYNQRYTTNPDANSLHILGHNKTAYKIHSVPLVGTAPWMDDFFTWAIGHLVDLGFHDAMPLLRWKAHFPVDRMVEPGVCWLLASAYALQVRDTAHAPFYATVAEAYRNTFPVLATMPCGGADMLAAADFSKPGEMYGYPWSPTGYPANLQIALAAAVDSGISNADEAWQRFKSRSIKPDYGNYPNFAVVPRRSAGVPAPRVSLYASPNPVRPGARTTLHWSASGADTCSANWLDGTATNGEQTVGPINGKVTYRITCSGAGGTAVANLVVMDTTIKKPAVVLTAAPPTVRAGQIATLSWHADNATRCAASGGWSGRMPVRGDEVVGPLNADTKFTMTCGGSGGSESRTVAVHVDAGKSSADTDSGDDGGGGGLAPFGILWMLGLAVSAWRRRYC